MEISDRSAGEVTIVQFEGNLDTNTAPDGQAHLDGLAGAGKIRVVIDFEKPGLGGPQTRPFLLYPSDWELDLAPLLGTPTVYQQLRRWMEDELGLCFGAAGDDAATELAPQGQEDQPT